MHKESQDVCTTHHRCRDAISNLNRDSLESTNHESVEDTGLSPQCVPAGVEQMENSDFIYAQYALRVPAKPSSTGRSLTPTEYMKGLPPYCRRLICWSKHHDSLSVSQSILLLKQSLKESKRLHTSMDGGMVGNQGSFGFIIASSWTPIWISAGPVDMDPTTASSSRPEMAGYAELWETLLML